jgi:hypothetical protein
MHYFDNYNYHSDYGHDFYRHRYGPLDDKLKYDPIAKIFDPKTITTIEGKLLKVEPVFESGVGTSLELLVYADKRKIRRVYLGPAWYIVDTGQEGRLKVGDDVTVSGSQVTLNDEAYIIATIVKRGNGVLRLRANDGAPAWVGWSKTCD